MQHDIDFAIWCAQRCVHLWNAPDMVKEWLEDPRPETAKAVAKVAAAYAAWAAAAVAKVAAAYAEYAAAAAARAAAWAAEDAAAHAAEDAAYWAAEALNTTVVELRLDYVKTWTDDELAHADDDWIEVSTVELFARESMAL